MEGDPHRVLGRHDHRARYRRVGASQGYLYMRGEYPLAVKALHEAIAQARAHGVIGKNILGSGFSFDVDIRIGAGAFVCGEETALMASVEGRRGTPRMRPPYPTTAGLWGAPTVINNVETFANIVPLFDKGAEQFASIGTEKSKGTKIFALAGKLKNTGLIEVPMGITLREIVYEIGGGIPGHGASRPCRPAGRAAAASRPSTSTRRSITRACAQARLDHGLGRPGGDRRDQQHARRRPLFHGVLRRRELRQVRALPGRHGPDAAACSTRSSQGRGRRRPAAACDALPTLVKRTSLCGLGQSAPNPVLSTLRYFGEEYEARCSARCASSGMNTTRWMGEEERQAPRRIGRMKADQERSSENDQSLTIDGQTIRVNVDGPGRRDRAGGRPGARHRHSATLLPSGTEALGRLPAVPGRGRGPAQPGAELRPGLRARHGGAHPKRATHRAAPRHARPVRLRPPARLRHLRQGRRLRAAEVRLRVRRDRDHATTSKLSRARSTRTTTPSSSATTSTASCAAQVHAGVRRGRWRARDRDRRARL